VDGHNIEWRTKMFRRQQHHDDDVGERTAESDTQSLFQLAPAAEGGIDLIGNLCTSLSIEVDELRAAMETTV
jgi:hypothetical protein